MKAATALVFAFLFLHAYSSNSEKTERETVDDDYQLRRICRDKSNKICGYERYNDFPTKSESSEEELHLYCSFIVPYLKCRKKEYEKCMGYMDLTIERILSLRLATYEKACDKDSSWNKVLSKHMKCIENKLMSYKDTCLEEENRIGEAITKLYNLDIEGTGLDHRYPIPDRAVYYGLKTAFRWSCALQNIEMCGEDARTVSEEILKSFDWPMGASDKKFHSRIYSALDKFGLSDEQILSIKDMLLILEQNSDNVYKLIDEEEQLLKKKNAVMN